MSTIDQTHATRVDGVRFRTVDVPRSLAAPGADDMLTLTDVRNRIYRELNGHDDEDIAADYLTALMQSSSDETRHVWLIERDGEAIGRIGVDVPHEHGSRSAYALIELLAAHHGHGIGRAAHALVVSTARHHGRDVVQSWVQHVDAPGERLSSPTGFGSIPNDHAARYLARLGYTLEQVERRSSLDPRQHRDRIDALLADARTIARDYDTTSWLLPTPREHIEGYARMKSRMSTDAPHAGMESDAELWDAARVARHEQRYLDGGQTLQVTAARHRSTGELVAYNELVIAADHSRVTNQEDTLVLAEHGGHRLGQLVKCAGLVAWRDVAPDTPKIITYNAEENRPMLDINERIGFAPEVYIGAWKTVLS